MPITIVGAILQNFIFGEGFCRILPYIQVVAVFVSVWTMVSLSMERYFAICRPLTSRGWQTKAHAYKLIGAVWLTGFILFIPTVVFTKLTPLSKPHTYKCRDEWPDPRAYKAYTTCLFSILMVIPLLVMVVAYSLIIVELWRGMQNEHSPTDKNNSRGKSNGDSSSSKNRTHSHPRSTSSNVAKRRVVKMLIVIVLLFFVCWMPSWCLNMWYFYDSESALTSVSALDAAVVKLLTYISSCVNPITYCFMNKKFRQGFLEAFGCCGKTTEAAGVGTYSAVGSTRLRSTVRNFPNVNLRHAAKSTPVHL
uniref:Cholecystokinin receptor type A-like n=1 Tax=Saccoglossus kowalevskii TaxID=10224 RepID=A0ABM0M3W4_SACKO|nr:PREDICTED: cholecystokinin receptor type A-like [Saccoglossus kowalevskii]